MISEKHFSWFKEYKRRQRNALLKDMAECIGSLAIIAIGTYVMLIFFAAMKCPLQ